MRLGVIALLALVACGAPAPRPKRGPIAVYEWYDDHVPSLGIPAPSARGLILQVRTVELIADLAPPGTARLSTSKSSRVALAMVADRTDERIALLDRDIATLTEEGFLLRAILVQQQAEPDRERALAVAEDLVAHVPASSKLRPIAEYVRLYAQNELTGDPETADAMLDLALAHPGSIIEERAYELGALGLEESRDVPTMARAMVANRWLAEHGSNAQTKMYAQRRLAEALALQRDPTALTELCRVGDVVAPKIARLLIDDGATGQIREACATKKCPCDEEIVRATARLADDEDREDVAIDLYTLLRKTFPHARDRIANQCRLIRLFVRGRMAENMKAELAALPNDATCNSDDWIPQGKPAVRAYLEAKQMPALSACAADTKTFGAAVWIEFAIGRDDRVTELVLTELGNRRDRSPFAACVADAFRRHRWLDLRYKRFRTAVIVRDDHPVSTP